VDGSGSLASLGLFLVLSNLESADDTGRMPITCGMPSEDGPGGR